MDRGAVTKSQKGKKAYVERKVGKCFQWKGHGHAVSVITNLYKETCTVVRDERDDRLLPHQIRKPRLTEGEKNLPKTSGNREESSSDKRSKIPCRYKNCTKTYHVNLGILPCVKTTSLRPSKKSKKDGAKGSVALLKESTQLGCVSQGSYPRKSVLREQGRLGSTHTVKFSKSTWPKIKIRERKGPSRAIIQKCEPHERSPCAPKFEERSQEEMLHLGFGETHLKAQECEQSYVLYSK